MGQRCQISACEHLEDVNIINANPIPLTAFGDGAGETSSGEMKHKKKKKKRTSANAQEDDLVYFGVKWGPLK